jgi:hypothetical protein
MAFSASGRIHECHFRIAVKSMIVRTEKALSGLSRTESLRMPGRGVTRKEYARYSLISASLNSKLTRRPPRSGLCSDFRTAST